MTYPAPSPQYMHALSEAREHHLSSKTYSGKFLRPHAPHIKQVITDYGVRSALDYGCGKGEQYRWISHGGDASIPEGLTLEQYWGIQVHLFDPAYPPLATPPDPRTHPAFDLTMITHVLGSIPVWDLNAWVMPSICAQTRKVVYIAEKLGDVRKQVFSAPQNMPRWTAQEWRRWTRGWSSAWPELYFVLALHERTEQGKEMTVEHMRGGKTWQRI